MIAFGMKGNGEYTVIYSCSAIIARGNFFDDFLLQIQVYGFNAELYHNMSEAQHKSQGLVAISLMVQVSAFSIRRFVPGESFPRFSSVSWLTRVLLVATLLRVINRDY